MTGCWKIGNLKLKNPYFLAPMEKVNDIAFRILCKKAGAGLSYTGMTNPLTHQKILLDDKPALQIFSKDERGIKEFIKKYERKISLIDFNLGCPSKAAKKHRFGCFLHNKPRTIEKILSTIRNSTKKPFTIKIRKSKQAIKIAKTAEKYCNAITIHPRTQEQGYSGKPDIDFARKLKSKLNIPVIYSGNVNLKNADSLLKEFDFVMIGREAIGNPNIFSQLTGKTTRKLDFNDYLKLARKYKFPFSQIKFQAMNFTRFKKNARELRMKISRAEGVEEIERIFNSIK